MHDYFISLDRSFSIRNQDDSDQSIDPLVISTAIPPITRIQAFLGVLDRLESRLGLIDESNRITIRNPGIFLDVGTDISPQTSPNLSIPRFWGIPVPVTSPKDNCASVPYQSTDSMWSTAHDWDI